jgi:hypothetical protein
MTKDFRTDKENILDSAYQNKDILPICETFNRDAFDDVLAQQDCVGIRIYLGMDKSSKIHAIIVGVDSDNKDILVTDDEKIIDAGQRCPNYCPPDSPLNS